MKEIPMLFSTEMVQAILQGRKTQTCRLVKGFPLQLLNEGFTPEYIMDDGNKSFRPFNAADRIYVRETWAARDCDTLNHRVSVEYAATPGNRQDFHPVKSVPVILKPLHTTPKWSPSIHMPKELARLWLEIESIKLDRLMDISPEDCELEGAPVDPELQHYIDEGGASKNMILIHSFQDLWDSKYGEGATLKNPWVWVINFRKI